MIFFDTLLSNFFGNSIFMGLVIIMFFVFLVIFIRTQKQVIEGVLLLAVYGMSEAAYIQKWAFYVVIIIVGVDIAKSLLDTFTS